MPHPKQRHSKQRTRTRRAHHALDLPHVMNCSNCGAPVLRHRVCSDCGFYKGKLAIDKNTES